MYNQPLKQESGKKGGKICLSPNLQKTGNEVNQTIIIFYHIVYKFLYFILCTPLSPAVKNRKQFLVLI
jgi:hypothetical protein